MGDAQKRADHKASIDRMSAYITGNDFQTASIEDIEVRLKRLEHHMESFDAEHSEIVKITLHDDAPAIEMNRDLKGETEDAYFLIKANLARKLNALKNPPLVPTTPTPQNSPQNSPTLNDNQDRQPEIQNNTGASSTQGNQAFQPPQNIQVTVDNPTAAMLPYFVQSRTNTGLDLAPHAVPKFNGDFAQWLTFHDSFLKLVHEDKYLYPIAKFNALAQALMGDAANIIAGLPRSDENYDIAWSLVCQEYNKPRLIHDALMKTITNLNPMSTENVLSLKFIIIKYRTVIRQLEALGTDIAACDRILSYQLCSLLDPATRRAWELKQDNDQHSSIGELLKFLDRRVTGLSLAQNATIGRHTTNTNASNNGRYNNCGTNSRPTVQQPQSHMKSAVVRVNQVSSQPNVRDGCPACSEAHEIDACPKFEDMNPFPRSQKVKSWKLCFGCLSKTHTLESCTEPPCTYCNKGKKHHRLLCFTYCDDQKKRQGTLSSHNLTCEYVNIDDEEGVLLGTADVLIQTSDGEFISIRALLDNASQANVISEACVQRLRLNRRPSHLSISPVGGESKVNTRGIVRVTITPTFGGQTFQISFNAVITKKVTSFVNTAGVDLSGWPKHITENLADSHINSSGTIDLLLGANIWSRVLMAAVYASENSNLVAQKTRFGWVVFGGIETPSDSVVGLVEIHEPTNAELNESLERFWKIDAIEKPRIRSAEEAMVEEIFVRDHERLPSGQFMVPVPFKPNAGELGESKMRALRAFRGMESRFQRQPVFRQSYIAFMRNLIDKNIMTLVDRVDLSQPHFYLPHHGITPPRKKFRTVFNGSAVTSTGESLNSIQMTGEKLQDNLSDIIIRFRLFRIALTGDIAQMYPNVLLKPEHHHMQLAFWRENNKEPIKTYCINRVMFGMKHALHSAVRSLRQCAIEGANEYPIASKVALRDFYVDDLITGTDEEEEAIKLQQQMTALLASGGFPIKKWASNSWSVTSAIDKSDLSNEKQIEFFDEEMHSVLGVIWLQSPDAFTFIVDDAMWTESATKRSVASDVCKLFDPIGLLTPVTIRGRIFIREIWLNQLDWDTKLPEHLLNPWLKFRSTMKEVEKLTIPRWIGTAQSFPFELIGFADASNNAYAAAIYYKVVDERGIIKCGLLTSKARVAPIKRMTVPRLELQAALLTTQLMETTIKALGDRDITIRYFSDSTTVIAWLKKSPHVLKDFVSHRVCEIQETTKKHRANFRYVPSADNPADVASRGCDAPDLLEANLWWYGPEWLTLEPDRWPKAPESLTTNELDSIKLEEKPPKVHVVTKENHWLLDDFESISRLNLVTAFVLRFVNNTKAAVAKRKLSGIPKTNGKTEPIVKLLERVAPVKRIELLAAEKFWCKMTQASAYAGDLNFLRKHKELPRNSKLMAANPIIDEDGLLRVGGRLDNALISYNEKHPIILPGNSLLCKKLIMRSHLWLLHGGIQLVKRNLRENYWFTNGRDVVKNGIDCMPCKILKREAPTQKMAPLVTPRVTGGERPFTVSSIDYAGPFELKRWHERCNTTVKGYVCVFICMATRAIHLEMILDLTTESFIDAYQRFASRRGHCRKIISDNASTFVSAKRHLGYKVLSLWKECSELSTFTSRGIDWEFIMPVSPHQGGSHESAVKLFKTHFYRVVKNEKLSVPQFQSLITRIGGCLNSRPLGALSEESSDDLALTPAHFLTGGSMEAVAVDASVTPQSSIGSKWRHLQLLHQQFWKRWQADYINGLQKRNKWHQPKENLKVGDVVIMRDDNCPPTLWRLAQIHELHPGKDGLVRNVTVRVKVQVKNPKPNEPKFKDQFFQRAIQRLCKLVDCDKL